MASISRAIFIIICISVLGYSLYDQVQMAANNLQSEKKNGFAAAYNSYRICDRAWENPLAPPPNTPKFDVTMQEGCFSGTITMPRRMYNNGYFYWQPLNGDSQWWVALWFEGYPRASGPYHANEMPQLTNLPTPIRFRIQGHGRILFYSNNPPLNDIELRQELDSHK